MNYAVEENHPTRFYPPRDEEVNYLCNQQKQGQYQNKIFQREKTIIKMDT